VNSQSYLNPFSFVVRSLATPPTAHLDNGDQYFLARLVLILNVQWDILSRCHKLQPSR